MVPGPVDIGNRSVRRDLAALESGELCVAPSRLPHRGKQRDAGLVQHTLCLAWAQLIRGKVGQAVED
jgi:hypothetical protein